MCLGGGGCWGLSPWFGGGGVAPAQGGPGAGRGGGGGSQARFHPEVGGWVKSQPCILMLGEGLPREDGLALQRLWTLDPGPSPIAAWHSCFLGRSPLPVAAKCPMCNVET